MEKNSKNLQFSRVTRLLSPPPRLDETRLQRTKQIVLLHYRDVFGSSPTPLRRTLIASYLLSSLIIGAILFFSIRARQSQTTDELHIIQTDLNSLQIGQDQFL